MADDFVQVAPDNSAGKKIDNSTVVTGAGTVYRQRVSIGDAGANNNASVSAAGALKVDGSAATQPVSGIFFQATQPVSGTFWQAVQPVSGTFYQATQPVSIAGTVTTSGTVSGAVALSGDALTSLQVMRRDLNASFLKPRPAFWARRV